MTRLAAGPEFDLIRRFTQQARQTHPLVSIGSGDDCAIIGDFAVSVDASVENVHFRRAWLNAEEISWRATSAALSDLAAVAAEPVAVLVTLAMPQHDTGDFAEQLMRGAIAATEAVGAALVGGDVTSSELLLIDVVVIGRVDSPVLRSHAKIGDEVWVTGLLGGAAAAVSALTMDTTPRASARARYARPQPRTREARWLHERGAVRAMIDLSDGLYGDLHHIAAASNCGIVVDPASIPIDQQAGASFELAVTGGEDYELVFSAAPGSVEALQRDFTAHFNLPLTRIGEVTTGSGLNERTPAGTTRPVSMRGYQHFRKQES